MVVTVEPSACAASMVQLFTACPSTITVHAPHKEVSHPTCVPVRFSTSRMYCTSSRRGSISFWCVTPFTVTLIVFFIAPPRIQQQGNFWSQDILNGSRGTCHTWQVWAPTSRSFVLNFYRREDHIRLAKTIQQHLKRHWVVSYDNVPAIREYYSARQCFLY